VRDGATSQSTTTNEHAGIIRGQHRY